MRTTIYGLSATDFRIGMLSIMKLLLLLDVGEVFTERADVIVCLIDEGVLIETSSVCIVNGPFFGVSLTVKSLAILVLVSSSAHSSLKVGLEARTLGVLVMERHN